MNICEYLRKECVDKLFTMDTFSSAWPQWRPLIEQHLANNPSLAFDLGDHLSDIFRSTANGRTQSGVSSGGAAWEALVCWYTNLCLAGTRTVVIKHSKALIPQPIYKGITVTYDNFPSNTESDLIAITFPNHVDFTTDINSLNSFSNGSKKINTFKKNGKFNYNEVIDYLVDKHFDDIKVCIIQCKTNWNDNAQIPMLWDMIYSGLSFARGVSIGVEGYSIANQNFKYAFVTVPSNVNANYTVSSTCVQRVRNLSGGNYWGKPTIPNVAKSIKEIFTNNFTDGLNNINIRTSIRNNLSNLNTEYGYFQITI